MTRRYVRGQVQRAEPDGPIRFTFATEGVKADGLDLRMDRVDLQRFQANPIIGYGHDYFGRESLPIGRAVSNWVDGPRWVGDVEFDSADPFAAEVERKYRGGFLHAVSVGFDFDRLDRAGAPDRWEPLEVSAVPVPMDPDATVADGRVAELVRALREGKVLSAGNKATIQEAVAALQAVLDAAGSDDGEGRAARAAIASHSTATTEAGWDGPAAVAAAPNDAATLAHMHAWRDPDGDPDEKATYKLPHHGAGADTAANLPAVRNALSRLPQSSIPDGDASAVEAHLRRHLDDAEDGRAPSSPRLTAARRRFAARR